MAFEVFRAAAAFPLRPASAVRELRARGDALLFAAIVAVAVSLLAGLRAGLARPDDSMIGFARLGSSLFGFVAFSPLVAWIGRRLGGTGSHAIVAAALVGCTVPFLLVDGLWILVLAAGADGAIATAATAFERASWLWALVLLVLGIAEAQSFSRGRALASVLLLGLGAAATVAGIVAVRALAS